MDGIVAEAEIRPFLSDLRARMDSLGEWRPPLDVINHEVYGDAFLYYLGFKHWPEMLRPGISRVDAFYNEYYWFRTFKNLHGTEPGLETMELDMLGSGAGEDEVDWDFVAEIHQTTNGG
jgi:hypothetical protein